MKQVWSLSNSHERRRRMQRRTRLLERERNQFLWDSLIAEAKGTYVRRAWENLQEEDRLRREWDGAA